MTAISAAPLALLAATMSLPVDAANGTPQRTTVDQLSEYISGRLINASSYEVKGDGRVLFDVTMTNGGSTVTSAGYPFTAADVGKLIAVKGAAAATATSPIGFNSLCGYIGSVSGGVASIVTTKGGSTAVTAQRAITAGTATFGTDDTDALRNVYQMASARYTTNGVPVMIQLPAAIMVIRDNFTVQSGVSWRGMTGSMLHYIRETEMGAAVFTGLDRSGTAPYLDVRFESFGINLLDSYLTTGYSVTKKCFYIQSMARSVFRDLTLLGSHATAIGVDFLVDTLIADNRIYFSGRSNDGTSSGGAGIGIGTTANLLTVDGVQRAESTITRNNFIFAPSRWGIFHEAQGSALSSGHHIVADNIVMMTAASVTGISDSGNPSLMIVNNRVVGTGVGAGIAVKCGLTAGSSPVAKRGRVAGNVVSGCQDGFLLNYDTEVAALTAHQVMTDNTSHGNTRFGYRIATPATASYVITSINLADNTAFDNGSAGFAFVGTAPVKRINLKGIRCYNNGTNSALSIKSGVYFGVSADIVAMETAEIWDDTGNAARQTFGIEVGTGAAVTNARLPAYAFDGHLTAPIGGTGTITGTKLTTAAYP